MSKAPPIPPEQGGDNASGDSSKGDVDETGQRRKAFNQTDDRRGRDANIAQNTHHQGYQQDR